MIIIKKVKSKGDLKKFVKFPIKLYKDNKYYCPTLNIDEMQNFTPKKNPASEYSEQELFLAYDQNKIVGRIGLIINHSYNKKMNVKQLRFTRFDTIDDFNVTKALFDEAIRYAKENNLNEIIGPIGFCDLDKQGLLVEGFEEDNIFITPYNDKYYLDHLERIGFEKDADWLEFQVNPTEEGIERIKRVSEIVQTKYGFYVETFKSKRKIKPVIEECFEVINEAYKNLYGVVILSKKQINMYISQFILLVNLEYVYVLRDKNAQVIGFGLLVPSLFKAVKKSNGRLFPLGFFRILKALKTEKVLDMYLIAVKPEFQSMGGNALIMNEAIKYIKKNNITYCETGPELEENVKVQAQWKCFDVRQHKKRRCLKLKIDKEDKDA